MKDAYKILKVKPDATEEDIRAAYEKLRDKYSEERFLSGEKGNTAAEKLTEVENAWTSIQHDFLKKQSSSSDFGNDLGYVDDLVKQGKYNEAQEQLDSISNRTAEWHYLQSIIFYKREWLSDSQTQLELAINLDPVNTKYRTALDRLKTVMGNPTVEPTNLGDGGQYNQEMPPHQGGTPGCLNSCSTCCMGYCLADCCCSMLRCC